MSNTTETFTLRVSGDAAAKLKEIAEALAKVDRQADKAEKSLDKVGSGGGGPSGGLGLEVGNAASGAALGAMGAAIGVAVGAYAKIGEIVTSSMALVVEKTAGAKAASEELARSWEDMQLALGKAILGPDGGASLLEGLANVVGQVTASIQRHSAAIGSAFNTALTIGKGLAFVLSITLQAALTPLALLIDGVVVVAKGLYAGFLGLKAGALIAAEGIGEAAHAAGLMSDEALADLQKATADAAKEFDDFQITTAGATSALWGAGDAVRNLGSAAETIGAKIDPVATFLSTVATKALTARKALEDMLALSPEELGYLRELNQQTREYQQSLAALQGIGLEAPKVKGGGGGGGGPDTAAPRTAEQFQEQQRFLDAQRAQALAEANQAEYNAYLDHGQTVADLRLKQQADLDAQMDAANRRFKDVQNAGDQAKIDAGVEKQKAAWTTAFSTMEQGVVSLTSSLVTMSVEIARGQASWTAMGDAALGGLGALFTQVGQGLLFSGGGLAALFTGNPAGVIAAGAGLMAVGAVMSGFAGGGSSKPTASSGGGAGQAVRDMAKSFMKSEKATTSEQTIVFQVGTREISREIVDMQRRRQVGGAR